MEPADINILYVNDALTGQPVLMRQLSVTKIQEKENFSYELKFEKNYILLAIPCRDGTMYLVILPE